QGAVTPTAAATATLLKTETGAYKSEGEDMPLLALPSSSPAPLPFSGKFSPNFPLNVGGNFSAKFNGEFFPINLAGKFLR
ncbi:MAG: hypothetical protein O7D30_10600, partial [Rickettsia endosymbiont of Ixodes persulcatus]|nr:hypothetical protein [Rickettsia endosymbiont of Ixodes persulcatus]